FRSALGPALRAVGRARLLPAAVVAVLSPPGHGDADPRARGGVRVLRRGAGRAALRSDASGRERRPARGRRPVDPERRVPALRRALGLSASSLPAVPSADEGQDRAADPLLSPELLLRAGVRQR